MATWTSEAEFLHDINCLSDFNMKDNNTVIAKPLDKAEHTLRWYDSVSDSGTPPATKETSDDIYSHEVMNNVTYQVGSVVGNYHNNEAIESYLKCLQYEDQLQSKRYFPDANEEVGPSHASETSRLGKSVAENIEQSLKNFLIMEPKSEPDTEYTSSASISKTDTENESTPRKQKKRNAKKVAKLKRKQTNDSLKYKDVIHSDQFNAFNEDDFPTL